MLLCSTLLLFEAVVDAGCVSGVLYKCQTNLDFMSVTCQLHISITSVRYFRCDIGHGVTS